MIKGLGIDVGTARIGLAICDGIVAVPLETVFVKNWNQANSDICKKILDNDISVVVVGMPQSLNNAGESGASAKMVKKFITTLKKTLPLEIKVVTIDERFTTTQANKDLIYLSQKKKRNFVDQVAAMHILQRGIDKGLLKQEI